VQCNAIGTAWPSVAEPSYEDRMRARTLLLALCLLLCGELPAFAKGSAVHKEDTWDPHHIDNLPVEVRQYIDGICKGPPSMISPPILRRSDAGGSTSNICDAKAWVNFATEISVSTLTSLPLVRISGYSGRATPTAASSLQRYALISPPAGLRWEQRLATIWTRLKVSS
jgi:hypothetical protein